MRGGKLEKGWSRTSVEVNPKSASSGYTSILHAEGPSLMLRVVLHFMPTLLWVTLVVSCVGSGQLLLLPWLEILYLD